MGISVWQILVLLLIVILLFGTKKLRNIGGDLGEAVKGFKKGVQDQEEPVKSLEQNRSNDADTIGSEFSEKTTVSK